MTVTTLRPDGTFAGPVLTEGFNAAGAGSLHAALSDESDSSYVVGSGPDTPQRAVLSFDDLTPPSGAVVTQVAVRLRGARTSPGTSTVALALGSGALFSNEVVGTGPLPDLLTATLFAVSGTSPSTVTALTAIAGPLPNDLRLRLAQSQLGSSATALTALRIYAVYIDVTYVEKPELTVDLPTGTLEDTNVPSASWTLDIDGDGGAQTHYEVAVVADGADPDTDPILGSGVVAGSVTSWSPTTPLPDGDYDCYVRIAQTVNGVQHWSDWEKSDFVIDVLLPADPSFTLVPETSSGRMRLDIEEAAGGDATTDVFEVQASDDGGVTWRAVRTVAGWGIVEEDGGAAMAWDRESGNGAEVAYRVRAGHNYSGLFAWSAWVEDTGAWGPSRTCWLKHPLDASQDLAVRIDAYGESSIAARQSQMHPLGRSSVIIAADKHGPETGAVTFLTPDQEARDALKTLLRANPATPFLFQVGAADKRPDRWVIFGQIDTAYIVDKSWIDDTRETLGWTDVPRP